MLYTSVSLHFTVIATIWKMHTLEFYRNNVLKANVAFFVTFNINEEIEVIFGKCKTTPNSLVT